MRALCKCLSILPVLQFLSPWVANADNVTAFQQAAPALQMQFPRDFGSHPKFQTEWWYYTGQLVRTGKDLFRDGADFGFQLTFFRRAEASSQPLPWDQGFLAHAALLDVQGQSFLFDTRISGGGLKVAGAAENVLNVWNRDWRAETVGGSDELDFSLDGQAIRVRLSASYKGVPVLHGQGGYSKKGDCAACASHYYSLPGIAIEGRIVVDGKEIPVQGLGWMDHEFMSNALQETQSGWDWFSLMFKDGRALMLYKLRKRGGGVSYAAGTLIEHGRTHHLASGAFSIEELKTWKSTKSNARYPSAWRIRVPQAGLDETLQPLFADQEVISTMADGVTYWEGAVKSGSGQAIGYVEMTGYDQALGAKF